MVTSRAHSRCRVLRRHRVGARQRARDRFGSLAARASTKTRCRSPMSIDVVYVPDHVEDHDAVRFPAIDPAIWEAGPLVQHEDEPALTRRVYTRRAPNG